MPITSTQTNASDNPYLASGSYADDAGSPAAMSIDVGFTPRYVQMVNQTTRVMNEWFSGMTSGHAVKTLAAGTRSNEASGGIVVSTGGEITFPAVAQNDQVRWLVMR
jgi:hypothetical protein